MSSTLTSSPLSVETVINLAKLIESARKGLSVKYFDPATESVRDLVLREVSTYDGEHYHPEAVDVRDQFVHLSGVFEVWYPVSQVLEAMARHEFAIRER